MKKSISNQRKKSMSNQTKKSQPRGQPSEAFFQKKSLSQWCASLTEPIHPFSTHSIIQIVLTDSKAARTFP